MSKDTVNNYKISIIVCCYNKDKTLQRTIDSLLNQTMFKELELIFVNDCSTDNTDKILNSLVEKHNKNNNIKIINLDTNKGVFVARKIGIQNATAEYVGFCDADDYVDKGYYEELYNSLFDKPTNGHNIVNKSDIDIIQTSSVKVVDLKDNIMTSSDKLTASYKKGTCDLSNYENLLDVLLNWGTLWNRLFKRNIISNVLKIPDDRINYMEDNVITIVSLLYSNKYKAIETKNFYHYNMDNSVYHLIKTGYEETAEDLNKVLMLLDKYIKDNNLLKFENIINRYKYYYLLARHINYLKDLKQTVYYIKNKDKLLKNDIDLSWFKTKKEQDYFINYNNNLKKILNTIYICKTMYSQLSPPNDKRVLLLNEAFNGVI